MTAVIEALSISVATNTENITNAARHTAAFGHIACTDDDADANRILLASPLAD